MAKAASPSKIQKVLVTGGAGYVGSVLVPRLLEKRYEVTVLDLYLYGREALNGVRGNPLLKEVKGDIRDASLVKAQLRGMDAVLHLACISNDPSYELNPELARSINYDATLKLIDAAIESGVRRFIYASSSSVYGVKSEKEVTEDLSLEPLTDYSKYKALGEEYLLDRAKDHPGFTALVLRPATVCGYSPRMRLDLTVNILVSSAVKDRRIRVFGGDQTRPHLHIEDMADLYVLTLEAPAEKIANKIFNAGADNSSVRELAERVKRALGDDRVVIETLPTNDKRSYRISSKKILSELKFKPKRTIEDAVRDLKHAFDSGLLGDIGDIRYYNIKTMQKANLA